ncbi:D-inositol-3-phosphate glycosyltransferase [Streptomyces sp. RB5]|uniref:D-inositol 3-phosphate glycosyltransferase n=1 Tax=Streptomyces smaragdinus TaxID=2585196 RepID=A0A7K0CS79_9ACTN|nr:DUF3492 domain-containing protein [Streptomyces smaragdinus]MQY16290.1 D-inositol-3-phosphate glycosyltransferase [Streptomyces smaragdinus]
MRIALLAEGGYPFAAGDGRVWCDRLIRGLADHEFEVYGLSTGPELDAAGLVELPPQVRKVRRARLWAEPEDTFSFGRRARERFTAAFTELAAAICADGPAEDRFSAGLYGLAELAFDQGPGLLPALRSEVPLRILEGACRAPGSARLVQGARAVDLLAVTEHLAQALRPLSLPWYGPEELAGADLCHALSGGTAALPGLLARHIHGTPLLVTEYGVRLRRHYLAAGPGPDVPARALTAGFERRLAAQVCAGADLLTPGNTHARRWQERLGAARERQRTVYPGMEAERFAEAGEAGLPGDEGAGPEGQTLVWVGRIEPAKDLIGLLHAFAEVRRAEPETRLLLVSQGGSAEYETHCRALAAQLFPDEAAGAHEVGDNPVSFEEIGGPELPDLAAAYASGEVLVLSSVVEGFPAGLVEGMFCGRASVSTDVGAVREVIGGTGLVVPPRNPRALADACLALLRDPARRSRLGAAARARALELFTVEQNVSAFRGIYFELISHRRGRRRGTAPRPFDHPAEAALPGRWAGGRLARRGGSPRPSTPRWSRPAQEPRDRTPALTRAAAGDPR